MPEQINWPEAIQPLLKKYKKQNTRWIIKMFIN